MNCVVRKIRDLCARGIIVQISMPIRKFDDDTKLLDPETFRVLCNIRVSISFNLFLFQI